MMPFNSSSVFFLAANGEYSRTWAIVLGVLAAIVSIALIIASWTRWGQTKSLTKCVVLAVLAHVWLLMYAYGTRVFTPGVGEGGPRASANQYLDISVAEFLNPEDLAQIQDDSSVDSEEKLAMPDLLAPEPAKEEPPIEAPPLLPPPVDVAAEPPKEDLADPKEPAAAPPAESVPIAVANVPKEENVAKDKEVEPAPLKPLDLANTKNNESTKPEASRPLPPREQPTRSIDQKPVPQALENRFASDRLTTAKQYGGDENTEAAVEWGLKWLAEHQSPEGHWDAAAHGAGKETKTVLGISRPGTGAKADTGMTGLALLAFLGAGHTHMRGKYAPNVRQGLQYLLEEQMTTGDLAGRKQIGKNADVHYARMYCHGMATLAIAEAYSMTGDPRLKSALQEAIRFTLRAQKPQSGGWRYLSSEDDPGDLSQFGWQAMAIHSADLGGLAIPSDTSLKLNTFLDLVASGNAGGLATYRPKTITGQRPTAAMTAEALACRMCLNLRSTPRAEREAKDLLLANLPGNGEDNLYYWYYGTLAMFQFQDNDWNTWNEAMKKKLLASQMPEGSIDAGAWDKNCIWAGYGGKVYCTALSCMCLEIYYRYLPIYEPTANQAMGRWQSGFQNR